jgi:hypothetical protein
MNLTEWRPPRPFNGGACLFTCGLPGIATFGREKIRVDDDTINKWVTGLPKANVLHIISLLGQNKNGISEFDCYPFRSSSESGPKPTFQEWFDERCGRRFIVHEFSMVDAREMPPDVLKAVKRLLIELIEKNDTVLVMDSAGTELTARVCEAIGYKRGGQSDFT